MSRAGTVLFTTAWKDNVDCFQELAKKMTNLSLKRTGRRNEEYYDVIIADGDVVGRIMLFAATPGGLPWMWSLAYGYHEDRTPTHGYAATREEAMQAFARSWHKRCECGRRGRDPGNEIRRH
jgi:hypothetical protein